MPSLERISKRLSFLLRHCTDPQVISLDGGWAPVSKILEMLHIDRSTLDEIVSTDQKTRYAYSADGRSIRANQGHSIPGVTVEMTQPEPPELLYHGTAAKCVGIILKEGLKPMSRQWVHISPDYATAVKVGTRHGSPIVLEFRAADFVKDGHELYLSANGVWQAKEVPPEYLSIADMSSPSGNQ